ncbi:leucyl aminopeptidase [Candidatus Sumerlaeota bacterium]|nr:leucyl aminopeptidase [Candidatus Sumerlaeota bacterium]
MKLRVETHTSLSVLKTAFLAFLVDLDQEKPLAAESRGVTARALKRYALEVKKERQGQPYIWGDGEGSIEHCWVFAPQTLKNFAPGEQLKIAAAKAYNAAEELKKKDLTIWLEGPDAAQDAAGAAEAVRIAAYQFDKYKSQPAQPSVQTVTIRVPAKALQTARHAVRTAEMICAAMAAARDLVNEPGTALPPAALARAAQKIASQCGLQCSVLDETRLQKQDYNGLLTVGKGSPNPPRMIIMRYKPDAGKKSGKQQRHIALVGKGITFDTGGISLKPSAKMWEMKGDMAGAAAVIAGMQIVAALKPDFPVTAIVAAAHNAIAPHAVHPGDVFTAKNGKTVHVDNTDAEGRLVLTDALHRAGEEGATHIVDFATLTGSVVNALGWRMAGIFANDLAWRDAVLDAGACAGEDYWPLPLYCEYRENLQHPMADLNNISKEKSGGVITAALFLQEFVPDGASWAHCDIAGPYLIDSCWRYFKPGATGFGVRTIGRLIEAL